MAVTKTPRKKPVSPSLEEEKPSAKAKTPARKATAKKAVAAPAEPAPPKPKAPAKAKAAAKPRATKARVEALTEPLVAERPVPPSPEPTEAPQAAAKPTSPKVSQVAPGTPELSPLAKAILVAICEGRAVEFIFADTEANAPRTFEPRHLTFDALSQTWFVWGWDRRYNAERHHRVDLLAEVNAVEGVGRAAQGPYPEGTPANQIGGWLGGEPIAVKATLLKQWVFAVKQAPPAFPGFKMEDQGDGQALVTFSATDLRAIARWIMQFGDGIQVLEPARLVDRVKQVGTTWAGRERPAAPAPAHAPRPAHRPEPAPEARRSEARPHAEQRPHHREARPEREREESSKAKPGKVEVIRFDRL